MYRAIEIKNFKCFKHFKMGDFARVNLIAGKNGAGKTALLEALFLHGHGYNPSLVFNINAFRRIDQVKFSPGDFSETPFDLIFRGLNVQEKVEIVGAFSGSSRRSLSLKVLRSSDDFRSFALAVKPFNPMIGELVNNTATAKILELEAQENKKKKAKYYAIVTARGITVEPSPPPPALKVFFNLEHFISPEGFAERFSELEVGGRKQEIIDFIKIIEPRIIDLALGVYGGKNILYADLGMGKHLPLSFVGSGTFRLTDFICSLLKAENGVYLIDEIENGLHTSVLEKLWTAIAEVAKRCNVQVFATTHSIECIHAAHQAFENGKEDDFRLHRLDASEGEVVVATYDRKTLDASFDLNLEVR